MTDEKRPVGFVLSFRMMASLFAVCKRWNETPGNVKCRLSSEVTPTEATDPSPHKSPGAINPCEAAFRCRRSKSFGSPWTQ